MSILGGSMKAKNVPMRSAPGPTQNYFFGVQILLSKSPNIVLKSCLKVKDFFSAGTLCSDHLFKYRNTFFKAD